MSLQSLSAWTRPFTAGPRLYLQRRERVDEPVSSRGRRIWIVSRELCRFAKFAPLRAASTAQQLAALRLQIERFSPFADTGSHAHFGPDVISVWVWDAQAVRDLAGEAGIDARRMAVLPETAMQMPGDGVRIVACLDGVEGQHWEGGSLLASRWWPALPDSGNWMLFQRGAAIIPDKITDNVPAPVHLPWLEKSWTNVQTDRWGGVARFDLRWAAAAIGVACLVGYSFCGAEWLRARWQLASVERQIADTSAVATPLTEARARALRDEAMISTLRDLAPYPSQLALMAEVAGILPKNETHFTQWSYDRGKLEVTVAAAHPLDATFFVRALDRLDRFRDVTVERAEGDNSLRIRLSVVPR